MNEMKQTSTNLDTGTPQRNFLGAITLSVILTLLSAYFISVLVKQPQTTIVYVALAIFISMIVAAGAGIVLALRGRQMLSVKILFFAINLLGIATIGLFVGRAVTASISVLIVSIMTIAWQLPNNLKRSYSLYAAGFFASMWAINWMDPFWRIQLAAAKIGPAAAGIFVLILVAFATREIWPRSMRNKLLITFIGVTLLTAGSLAVYIYVSTNNTLRNGLEESLTQYLDGVATSVNNLLDTTISKLTTLSLSKTLQQTVIDANRTYGGKEESDIQSLLEARDAQWRAADAANDDNDPLVQIRLKNQVAFELRDFQAAFPDNVEVFLTDKYGGLISATSRTSDYYQADEDWWQAAYNNGKGAVYIGPPTFDESSQALALQIAVPVHNTAGEVIGVLRTTFLTSAIIPILDEQIGQTGGTNIYIPGDTIYYFNEGQFQEISAEEFNAIQATVAGQGLVEMNYEGADSIVLQRYISDSTGSQTVNNLDWIVLFHQHQDEAFAPINTQIRGILFVAGGILLLAIIAAFGLSSILVRPIVELTKTAEGIAAGDLNSRAKITSSDEIGVLASAFNSMSTRLQDIFQGLEQRIIERTRNLELATEVGRSVSQVRSLGVMLKDAAEIIRSQFDLYYVQVYLLNPSRTYLELKSGTGEVGEQLLARNHSLPFNTNSINGRAAVEKKSVVIVNTRDSLSFKPNPLLPETSSEMAVPLIIGDRVIGVLDMQSKYAGALNKDLISAFEALAGQLAIAVQNANLLDEAERAQGEVKEQVRRLARSNWNEYLDAIHKPEHTSFVFDGKEIAVLPSEDTDEASEENALSVPIEVTGETIGKLVVEGQVIKNNELVNLVAQQVSQHIEDLRLLDSAERYRRDAEKAVSLQTVEGWKNYISSRSANNLGYMYDTREVLPQSENTMDNSAFDLPLMSRDEVIGKLAVQGMAPDDREAIDLVNAVANRLSSHIENLRLLEETRHGQVKLDQRAKQLETVAKISNISSTILEQTNLLQTVVNMTKEQFGLYHAHVYLMDQAGANLVLSAGAGETGQKMVESGHSISMSREKSLVARAAREKQAVIVNNVRSEPDFLPNPLLPDTQSEMAVPLVVGERVLGVMDVQADAANYFTQEDISIQNTLASQIAIALQNSQTLSQAQSQADREARLNIISQKIQSATTVDAVLQIAARELGHTLGAPITIAQLGLSEKPAANTGNAHGENGKNGNGNN